MGRAGQSLYGGRAYDRAVTVQIIGLANMFLALSVLVGWSLVGGVLSEPVSTATGNHMSGTLRPEILDYPFVLLWVGPMVATVLAWIVARARYYMLARAVAAYPLILLGLVFLWHGNFDWLMSVMRG